MTAKHTGSCFCGAVTLELSGAPEAMGYCHCSSCRSWSAGPVNAFTLWKPENVKVTKGADLVGRFQKSDNSERKWCKKCGGHFVVHAQDLHPRFVCGLCDVPSRAGKTREAAMAARARETEAATAANRTTLTAPASVRTGVGHEAAVH